MTAGEVLLHVGSGGASHAAALGRSGLGEMQRAGGEGTQQCQHLSP